MPKKGHYPHMKTMMKSRPGAAKRVRKVAKKQPHEWREALDKRNQDLADLRWGCRLLHEIGRKKMAILLDGDRPFGIPDRWSQEEKKP